MSANVMILTDRLVSTGVSASVELKIFQSDLYLFKKNLHIEVG